MANTILPLERGDYGERVRKVQRKLGKLYTGRVDGIYGPLTANAVSAWQRKHALEADGVVGPKTWARMFPIVSVVKPPVVQAPPLYRTKAEEALVRYAKSRLGLRYVLGAEVPKGHEWDRLPLDCSELVEVAYRIAHELDSRIWPVLSDGSWIQHGQTRDLGAVSASALKVGDLVFIHYDNEAGRVHHVGLYIGGGIVIEAKGKAYGVVATPVAKFMSRAGADWHRARAA